MSLSKFALGSNIRRGLAYALRPFCNSSLARVNTKGDEESLLKPSKNQVLSLYRNLLRASKGFHGYNFQQYAIRRTKDSFRSNKDIDEAAAIKAYQTGNNDLEVIRRQSIISNLFTSDKLVIEK
ncbi:hypothetical protein DSO57_1001957 [Entomophthora muscae]|uniref:Uncharacterized protein n=1 Tax=Entomophthora muscae TaxID=34485 RepID=A0ACC2UU62_9FUNG|nr:hypothetical protein DSO57_1001957 [Entomophthora muscae]